jgi:serine/threonine protein phosphatase PrpC
VNPARDHSAMQVHTALRAAGLTHPGLRRDVNEDRHHYDPARGIYIVVDGIGGQAAGEKAAETALALVRTRLERETGPIEDRMREAIGLANDEIYRLASLHPDRKGMACVLTAAVVTNGDVVVGHVGDTRLYKFRPGRIEKLTPDHSPVGEREDAGELSERDAMHHPRRNEVYRDVGSERHEPDDPGFIDVLRYPFEPDAALLLCSDGLTDLVPSAAIAEIVRARAGHPDEVVRGLVDAALAAGGKDNVTAVYVEGPRFAVDEDTRDLRSSRTSPPRSRMARWRLRALVTLLVVVASWAVYVQRDRLRPILSALRPAPAAATGVVRPGESINDAVQRARADSEVIVEPGEYRERLSLKSGVRVISRTPRAAVLRLPAGAAETDPAVIAADVTGAVLSGFRILGDAATPLGSAIVIRNASVTLNDLEIAGAANTGVTYVGDGGGSLVGSDLRNNAGAAIDIRDGASPRLAHNTFAGNATGAGATATIRVEPGAHPSIAANTFVHVRPDAAVAPAQGAVAAAVARDNWFIPAPAASTGRGDGRGRR